MGKSYVVVNTVFEVKVSGCCTIVPVVTKGERKEWESLI